MADVRIHPDPDAILQLNLDLTGLLVAGPGRTATTLGSTLRASATRTGTRSYDRTWVTTV